MRSRCTVGPLRHSAAARQHAAFLAKIKIGWRKIPHFILFRRRHGSLPSRCVPASKRGSDSMLVNVQGQGVTWHQVGAPEEDRVWFGLTSGVLPASAWCSALRFGHSIMVASGRRVPQRDPEQFLSRRIPVGWVLHPRPRLQIGAVPTSDHGVEPVHEVAGHHERWHCVLNDCRRDHPDLGRGWWAVERNGPIMSRWTDGEAVLALPAMRGTAERRAA